MNKFELRFFIKGKKLANWSYVGVVVPILGLAFGYIAKSILRDIPEQDERVEHRINELISRANAGIFWSYFMMVVSIVTAITLNFYIAASSSLVTTQEFEQTVTIKPKQQTQQECLAENVYEEYIELHQEYCRTQLPYGNN